MPTYEYQCPKCPRVFEVRQRITAPALETCDRCGGPVHRLLSAAPFILKGGGWYVTDYPSEARKKATSSESGSKEPAAKESAASSKDSASKDSASKDSALKGTAKDGGSAESKPATSSESKSSTDSSAGSASATSKPGAS
jgi:putative FmdB family regulatory protein